MNRFTDEELQEWFEKQYKAHYKVLLRYGTNLVYLIRPSMLPELEDLVQETLLCLFQKYETALKVPGDNGIIRWLMTTLYFKFKNRERKWRIRTRASVDIEGLEDLWPDPDQPIETLVFGDDKELRRLIKKILGEEKFQYVYDYYVRRISIDILAERKGVKRDTMKRSIYRWRDKCYEELKKDHKNLPLLLIFIAIVLLRDAET